MRKLIFILLLLPLSGFPQINLDSLRGIWNDTSQPDTSRCKAIQQISWDGYIFSQPDSAFYFAQVLYDFAKERQNKKFISTALHIQGTSHYLQGNYTKAIDYYSKSLKIRKEIEDKKGVADSYNNIGLIYKIQGNYAKAIDYYTKSLKIREGIGDKKGIATSLSNIGTIYKNQKNYTKAIDYQAKSLKIREEIGNKKDIATTLNKIGLIYKNQENYPKAIEYYTEGLKIKKELGYKKGIAISMSNIGEVYQIQGEYMKASEHYSKSLKIYEEIGDKRNIASSFNEIGSLYYDQGYYQKALYYSSKSLTLSQEVGAVLTIRNASKTLWRTHKKLGRYNESLLMYELYITTRDSIVSENNQKEVIRQEYKYNYEKQAATDSIKAAEATKIANSQLAAQKAENKQQQQQKYFLFGGLTLAVLFGGFIFNRFKITSKQKETIEQQKNQVDDAYNQLGKKNQEIVDSINYAKRIQSAILPPKKAVKKYLPNSFIFYKPKDIVSGDFYWLEEKDNNILFAAADCTGHGVPGAMVSVICNNGLNRSVREHGLTDPARILDKTREIVISEFEKSEEDVKDGMDIALCALNGNTLKYAGAHNPLWIIRKGATEIEEIKANKQPIGKFHKPLPYTTHSTELNTGDSIYIFSDGYADQFGGEKGKKFMTGNFKKLLLSIQVESMERQRELIIESFEDWRGSRDQLDDVCVIGLRV